MKKPKAEIVYRKTEELSELKNNPRTITKADLEKLKTSLKNNADYFEARPLILSDRTGELVVIAGNQRLRAARELGIEEVPTILLENLSKKREREIIIRDNVANGDWNMDILAAEWDIDELKEWGLRDAKEIREIVEDEPDPVDDEQTFSVIGEIYQLGDHRVFCGSFEDDEGIRGLFGDKKASCTFTDPPYNVAVKGRATGKTIQNDNMAHEDFQAFLDRAFECIARQTPSGG